jgi:hypothetical protein
MKKFLILTSVMTAVAVFGSCSSDQPANATNGTDHIVTTSVLYQCPMKCEGDKTYTDAGICPVCKMELVALDSYPAAAPDSLR